MASLERITSPLQGQLAQNAPPLYNRYTFVDAYKGWPIHSCVFDHYATTYRSADTTDGKSIPKFGQRRHSQDIVRPKVAIDWKWKIQYETKGKGHVFLYPVSLAGFYRSKTIPCIDRAWFKVHVYLFMRSQPPKHQSVYKALINWGGVPIPGIVPPIRPTEIRYTVS